MWTPKPPWNDRAENEDSPTTNDTTARLASRATRPNAGGLVNKAGLKELTQRLRSFSLIKKPTSIGYGPHFTTSPVWLCCKYTASKARSDAHAVKTPAAQISPTHLLVMMSFPIQFSQYGLDALRQHHKDPLLAGTVVSAPILKPKRALRQMRHSPQPLTEIPAETRSFSGRCNTSV